jgi:8-oxo-dGTP pyrophosphatase MutT (NUDIX family)
VPDDHHEPGPAGGPDLLVPSATVVLLRDRTGGPETLLLRRNARLAFAGGHWVFPGGRIDPADLIDPTGPAHPTDPTGPAHPTAGTGPAGAVPGLVDDDVDRLLDDPALGAAARRAAVRETFEETGLVIDEARLTWFAHWMAPPGRSRRFATWFYVAAAPEGDIAVDGGEIHDHTWVRPADALERRDAGAIELSPPTWVTLWQLRPFASVPEVLAALAARPPERFATRLVPVDDHVVALWDGDAGYPDHDPGHAGARHRLEMRADGWRYRRSPAPGPEDPDGAVS